MNLENIFLKAAMTGTISPPTTDLETSKAVKNSQKRAKKSRINFSQGEDAVIEAAYSHHKGDYKSMVKFITKHVDILPQNAQEYYRRSEHSAAYAKAAEERVRKRVASKILHASSSSTNRRNLAPKATYLEDEYHSPSEDEFESEQSEELWYDELDELGYKEEAKKRARYLPPSSPSSKGALNSFMKETKKAEKRREDEVESGKERGSKSKKKKIEDALPELLASVQEAAKAMGKWEQTLED
ncbi:hypothetical protein AC249_AIPGENE16294 [Exaiptasia diaphana]|nr:hypothetical protein AC249_AIPGENE16294 [Exaiptasia diaphana]